MKTRVNRVNARIKLKRGDILEQRSDKIQTDPVFLSIVKISPDFEIVHSLIQQDNLIRSHPYSLFLASSIETKFAFPATKLWFLEARIS